MSKQAMKKKVKEIVGGMLKQSFTQSLSVEDMLGRIKTNILGVQDYIMSHAGKGQLDNSDITIEEWYYIERYLNMAHGLVDSTDYSEEYQDVLEWFLEEVVG